MFVQTRKPTVLLVALAVIATAVAAFYMVRDRAGAASVPTDKAARDPDRAKHEWRDQGRRHAEEMVKARLDLAEHEEQLRIRELELSEVRSDLTRLRKRIEMSEQARSESRAPEQLYEDEKVLRAKEQKLRADVLQARKKFFAAEEGVRLLEREQALQRDRVRARLDAAEESIDVPLRLQEVEQELERLRRALAELRRHVQRRSP